MSPSWKMRLYYKKYSKYNLTKGINKKKISINKQQVIEKIPVIDDWLDESFIHKHNLMNWNESKKLNNSKDSKDNSSKSFRRIVFDELCANFLTLSENRRRIRKRKTPKNFDKEYSERVIKKLPYELTNSQKKVLT